MWVIVFGVLLVAGEAYSTTVTGIDYTTASTSGGTLLRINGADFAQISMADLEHVGNKVYFVSNYKEYESVIVKDGSHETTLTCITSAMAPDYYQVKIIVDGVPVPTQNYCGGHGTSCVGVSVSDSYTPSLISISPHTTDPGALLSMYGRIFTSRTRSIEEAGSNGNTAFIRRIWIGGKECNLYNTTDDLYGITLGGYNMGTIQCLHSSKFVAFQNATFTIDGGYGATKFDPQLMRVSSDYRLYNFQTYAVISGVVPSSGSIHGGTLITVSGDYFDDSSIDVKVGGETCEVIERQDTNFTCETPKLGSHFTTNAFPGSRGAIVEVYPGLSDKGAINDVAYDSFTGPKEELFTADSGRITFTSSSAPTVVRVRGFFVPAKDGTYTISASGSSDVYVSTDQSMENKALSPGRLSLESGNHYYFEVVHSTSSNSGEFSIDAYFEETGYVSRQTAMADEEAFYIQTTSPPENEIQKITLNEWEEIVENSTNEVLELCIACVENGTCLTEEYSLNMHGISTGPLLSNFDASEVKYWIEQFPTMGGDEVEVVATPDHDDCISHYVITVLSKRGHLPLQANASDDTRVSAEVTVMSSGQPSLSSFTLAVNGTPTGHVTTGNINALAAAVKNVFGTGCPPDLIQLRSPTEILLNDFEGFSYGSSLYHGQVTSDDSYCGSQSVKNPYHLRLDLSDNALSLTENQQLCLAVKGSSRLSLTIKYNYKALDSDTGVILSGVDYFHSTFNYDSEDWEHTCHSIYFGDKVAVERFDIVFDYISLYLSRTNEDFFVDNLFIGELGVTQETLETLRNMRRLPLHDTLRLEHVSVTTSDDGYLVEMFPVNCGNGLPLLEIAYAQIDDTDEYTDETWGNSSISVTREQFAAPPIGGHISLELPTRGSDYGGILEEIPWNIEAAELEAVIEELNGVIDVSVNRDGTCRGYTWNVKFISPGGRQEEFIATGHFVNKDATIATQVTTKGGLNLRPIPSDWMRTANKDPQVEVTINKVPSLCLSNCSFTYDASITLSVTAATVTSGSVSITGVGFGSVAEDIEVHIGGIACLITSADEASIECDLQESPAGTQPLVVTVEDKGNSNSYEVPVPFYVTSISPMSGSEHGGTIVELSGSGFSSQALVTIGNSQCSVTEYTYTSITCETGESDLGAGKVVVSNGAIMDESLTFTFQASPATVSSLSTDTFSLFGGELAIHGSGFGSADPQNFVRIGTEMVTIQSWSDTEIIVQAPPHDVATVSLKIYLNSTGNANMGGNSELKYVLEIDDIAEIEVSLLGGIDGSLAGGIFVNTTEVYVGENDAKSNVLNEAELSFTIPSCGTKHYIRNDGTSVAFGEGYAWSPDKLEIHVGDEVVWIWQELEGVFGASYQVFTTSTSSTLAYDNNGFHSGNPSAHGSYSHRFNVAGKYHIVGVANSVRGIFMRNVITVLDPVDVTHDISARVGDYEVTLPDKVHCLVNLTPTIASISPNSGTAKTLITITGTGFSNINNDVTVQIGTADCTVETTSDTEITFRVGTANELRVGLYYEVTVHINGKGYSRSDLKKLEDRMFVLLPSISSVTPASGSVKGGTDIIIAGGGLSGDATVYIGGIACEVLSSTHTEITCKTKESVDGSYVVEVTASGLEATCTSDNCNFQYSTDLTPKLMSVTPTTVSGTQVITLVKVTGEDLFDGGETVVSIGEFQCTDLATTATEISCTVSNLDVGTHIVEVVVKGKGRADINNRSITIESLAEITSITPSDGSVHGGTEVRITGNGFVSEDTTVVFGATEVEIHQISSSEIVLFTPPGAGAVDVIIRSNGHEYPKQTYEYSLAKTPVVTAITPSSGKAGDLITLTITNLGDSSQSTIFLDEECAFSSSDADANSLTCTLGSRPGGMASMIRVDVEGVGLAEINESVTFRYEFELTDILPSSGSLGGGQRIVVNGKGMALDASILICDQICEKVPNLISSNSVTCVTPPSQTDTDQTCNVVVRNTDMDEETLEDAYSYMLSVTPVVSSVTPGRGGTAGGTKLTIEGSNLGDATNVTIDGVVCVIETQAEDKIICITEAHSGTVEAKVEVHMGTNGIAATDNAAFHYIDLWSSIFTWGGTSLPTEGDFVVIPEGQTVLFDVVSPQLSMLLIKGGKLIFEDKGEGSELVHLNANNILITHGGLLQIGTEEERYMGNAKITMHGHLRSQELPIYGTKTLGVRDGKLELHGKPVGIVWTVLGETANANDQQITLRDPVTWKVGDKIVIASTGTRHTQRQNEDRIITEISEDGHTLTLDEPLDYKHLGVTEQYTNGKGETTSFDYRAEVGLLSRNVVFEGSDNDQWHDTIPACPDGFNTDQFATQTCFQGRFGEEEGTDEFGASIMIHSPSPTTDPENPVADAHIEYVEFYYVGQAFRLGRYPIHWHLMGNMNNSYVRGCAIHKSFNRAVTIHATNNLLVEHNVLYNIMGGAFFIEDGVETGNVLQYNLAVFVKQSTSLLNEDITPASFWVTNPDNVIQHNHAAGGTHFGYWYRMNSVPDGPSRHMNVCPQKIELGTFRNNSAHTFGWYGIWIFPAYSPVEGSSCRGGTPKPAIFETLTAWHCNKGAEWVNGGSLQFHNFKLAGNAGVGMDIRGFSGFFNKDTGMLLKDNVFIGHKNNLDYGGHHTPTGIVASNARGFWIDGADFFNLGTALGRDACPSCGGFQNLMQNLKFTNTPVRTRFSYQYEAVIIDLDGTLSDTNEENTRVVPYSPIYDNEDGLCEKRTTTPLGSGVPAFVCKHSVNFNRFSFNGLSPSFINQADVTISNDYGNTTSQFANIRLTHHFGYLFLLRSQQTYDMEFANGRHFTNLSYSSGFYDFEDGDYVIMRQTLFTKPDGISINSVNNGEVGNTTEVTLSSSNLDWHYDVNTAEFTYLVGNPSQSRKKRSSIRSHSTRDYRASVNIYRCLFLNCIPVDNSGATLPQLNGIPEDAVLVTELTMEGNCMIINGTDPDEISVTIPKDCGITWGIKNATIKLLLVEGALIFHKEDVTISAVYIVNIGHFIAGWTENDPHLNKLDIILRGTEEMGPYVTTVGEWVNPKTFACFGTCELHGLKIETAWTGLATTAESGSTTLEVLDDLSNWAVGDEIVIGTTGFNPGETEKNKISGINGHSLILENPLVYTHKHMTAAGVADIRAQVGLLTRSITIKDAETEDHTDDGFGASFYATTKLPYAALARLSNVEFYHTGNFDKKAPSVRVGIVGKDSVISSCSFHDGYFVAISIQSILPMTITKNVLYRAVGDGIVVSGSGHTLTDNLVTFNVFPGTFGDRFEKDTDYNAAINIEGASQLTMSGNIVAGSERAGFKISSQACDTAKEDIWEGNVAMASLIGVMQMSSAGGCTLLKNFVIYKSWDYGIYQQTSDSVQVEDIVFIDCTVAYAPIIFGPSAISHAAAHKYARLANSTIIARLDVDECSTGMHEGSDDSLIMRTVASASQKAPSPGGGRTGVLLPIFASAHNGATFKSLIGNKKYPALYGELQVYDVTVKNFGDYCGVRDRIFYTNPQNEDANHPARVERLKAANVNPSSYVLIDFPSTSKINPADCVDMTCDGKRRVLIDFKDDAVLGGDGYLFPLAEYKWDDPNARTYGLGDYRIPKTMLTTIHGDRIPVDDIADDRGIARTDDCVYRSEYHAYLCKGSNIYEYLMLIIESLDHDTETRRLSPIALLTARHMDLYNGPQDHGWCSGYTCQKRLSTFHTIVPANMHTEIFFTSTPPRNFRFHLIGGQPEDKVTIAVWIPTPNKLDVHDGSDNYIPPLNSGTNDKGQTILLKPPATNPSIYTPTTASPGGANFLDFETRLLYLTVDSKVTIYTRDTITINFGFPIVTVDEFFGDNIVENIAGLLSIPADKIRVVNVVRETSSRKRRNADIVEYTVDIEMDDNDQAKSTVNMLQTDFQQGKVSVGGVQPKTMALVATLNDVEIAEQDQAMADGEFIPSLRSVLTPTKIRIVTSPAGEEKSLLTSMPTIHLLDDNDDLVSTADGWTVAIALGKSLPGADPSAALSGTTTITFTEGIAEFSDLIVSHSGVYTFTLTPTGDASHLAAISSESFTINERAVNAEILRITNSGPVTDGDELLYEIQLIDGTGNLLQDITFKGLTYKTEVSLDDPSIYANVLLDGQTIFDFSSTTGQLSTNGLTLSRTTDYHIYNVKFRLFTDPVSNYDSTFAVQMIQIYPENETDYIHTNIENGVGIQLKFSESYAEIVGSTATTTIETAFHNDITSKYPDVYFSQFDIARTSDENLQFTTSATAINQSSIDAFLKNFTAEGTLSYGSTVITLDQDCGISLDGECYGEKTTTSQPSETKTLVLVIVLVSVSVVVAALILIITYVVKRHQGAKVSSLVNIDSPTPSINNLQNESWGRGSPDSQMRLCETPVSRNLGD